MREMMGNRAAWVLCASLGAAVISSAAIAQSSAPPAPAEAATSQKDPDAVAALERMGASLRSLNNFSLTADATMEEVLTTGQKLQYAGIVEVRARKPDKLRLNSISDRKSRSFYYDGKTLTIFAPQIGYWGTVPAPSTIREMLAQAEQKHGIELPLADLFDLGQDPALMAKLTSAFRVGAEHVGGVLCEQYAMRQPNADWQIWIRQGAEALPCKMVITDTGDPSMPQYVAILKWNTTAPIPDSDFIFEPPANARKIVVGNVNP